MVEMFCFKISKHCVLGLTYDDPIQPEFLLKNLIRIWLLRWTIMRTIAFLKIVLSKFLMLIVL